MTHLQFKETRFTVHMKPRADGWRVYIERRWPLGRDTSEHMAANYGPDEQNRAELYALSLADMHDCAIQHH